MNSICIAGNIGRDADVRQLPNGDPVCSFSVADSQGREKPTIWWSCAIFGKRAESLAQYLTKGQRVTVTGTVSERHWKDKDGADRRSMDVRVVDIALQGGRREEDAAPARSVESRPAKPAASGFDDMDDGVPF